MNRMDRMRVAQKAAVLSPLTILFILSILSVRIRSGVLGERLSYA
jgi:hypothetical protein